LSVDISADAQATWVVPNTVTHLAPVAIRAGNVCDFAPGATTCPLSLNFDDPNSSGIVDLRGGGGSLSPGTVAGWIEDPSASAVGLGGTYPVVSNSVVRSFAIRGAFQSARGRPLLVAVGDFRPATMESPASFKVIGWAAFEPLSVPSGFAWRRGNHSVSGQLTTYFVDSDDPAPSTTTEHGVYYIRICHLPQPDEADDVPATC
jgi:hypothetical protein